MSTASTPQQPGTGAAAPSGGVAFRKGHGTGNDFLVLHDPDATLHLTPGLVASLCDRHMGLGADGVLRVVPTALEPGLPDGAAAATWFMDYRNADGSLAEMCGNGARVFAVHLHDLGLIGSEPTPVWTRGGMVTVTVVADGDVEVDMGRARLDGRLQPSVIVRGSARPGRAVHVPNPHCVVLVDSLDDVGSLREAPVVTPDDAFPEGVNVEFVVPDTTERVRMRVHERGSGETLACGTGAVAVAVDHALRTDQAQAQWTIEVDMPGGRVQVRRDEDDRLFLRGPAVLVADGVITRRWWEAHS